MRVETTHFVVMDRNKSLFLVNEKTGALSKMPSQAKRFNTLEQAEAAIQTVYKKWKKSGFYYDEAKFKNNDFGTLRMKTTHELLQLEKYPF